MRVGTIVKLISVAALIMFALSLARCAWDIRVSVTNNHSAASTASNDAAFRDCLRRASHGIGVATIDQINKCKEDTPSGK